MQGARTFTLRLAQVRQHVLHERIGQNCVTARKDVEWPAEDGRSGERALLAARHVHWLAVQRPDLLSDVLCALCVIFDFTFQALYVAIVFLKFCAYLRFERVDDNEIREEWKDVFYRDRRAFLEHLR